MSYLEIVDRVLEKQKEEKAKPQKIDISLLRLSELAKRNIATKIYSEVLGCHIWLCGNEQMAAQLSTVYTANEMKRLMSLNPDPQGLRNIHIAKTIFPGSKVVDSKLKETNERSSVIQW
ncbi:MAG: hypothetical protein ACM3SR_06550 [Ignavibacteriales bacterium]